MFSQPEEALRPRRHRHQAVTTDSDLASVKKLTGFANGLKGLGAKNIDMVTLPVEYDPQDPEPRAAPGEGRASRCGPRSSRTSRSRRPPPRSRPVTRATRATSSGEARTFRHRAVAERSPGAREYTRPSPRFGRCGQSWQTGTSAPVHVTRNPRERPGALPNLGDTLKRDIHPEYVETQVSCTCGASFTTRSTIDRRHHPRRRLLRVPPVLHGQAEDPRHRRPCGPLRGPLRQGCRLRQK